MTKFEIPSSSSKYESAEDIKPFLDQLEAEAEKHPITEIAIGGNTYGVGACKALAEVLAKQTELESIDLSDIFTGRLREEIPPSLDALVTALLKCEKLHSVNLSDNAFGIATIEPLEKFLSQHAPLKHLILANNGFGPEAGSRIGIALEKLAHVKTESKTNASLETVICGRNRLENGSMEAWAKFIAAHGTLKVLRIYQNGIRPEGVEHLMLEGLKSSPDLEVLDLHDNTFTYKGTEALTKVLDSWKNLKEIFISDCLLSAKGGETLGKALNDIGKLEKLESLKLQYNEIDEKGLELIRAAIEKNFPNLAVLELNGNRFSEDHEVIEQIVKIFEDRGVGELDELDDMEEETDDEDEEDEENEAASILEDADEEEDMNVALESDKTVDELADEVAKTQI